MLFTPSTPTFLSRRFLRLLFITLICILIARLVTLGAYPLFGTTEPRYAELARKILTLDDWVTLWVSPGVPLWGKPPLLFWLDALAMKLLGIHEFALRLPLFITSIFVLTLFWFWRWRDDTSLDATQTTPSQPLNHPTALIASLVYISTPIGFLAAGFVATDLLLTAGLMLSMLSLWHALPQQTYQQTYQQTCQAMPLQTGQITPMPQINKQTTMWHWLFFVGIAIGLLAKGPLSLVLLGASLFLWVLRAPRARLIDLWRALPWFRGLLLMAVLAFPWYVMAEIRTPGFLYHFIIGEHFERFLVKDWAGGRYAPSHGEPLGMIWWFAVESFLPWLALLMPAAYLTYTARAVSREKPNTPKKITSSIPTHDVEYLLCWLFAPLLFFTFSHNILEAYILPALPAFALLMSKVIKYLVKRSPAWRYAMVLTVLMPTLIVSIIFGMPSVLTSQSQKELLTQWSTGTPLFYVGKVPPSGIFYSNNEAKEMNTLGEIDHHITTKNITHAMVIAPQTIFENLSPHQQSQWRVVRSYSGYLLLQKRL